MENDIREDGKRKKGRMCSERKFWDTYWFFSLRRPVLCADVDLES